MNSYLSGTGSPAAGAPAATAADLPEGAPGWSSGAAALAGSNAIFLGFVLLFFLEYTGLHNEFGPLKALRVTTVLGYLLFAMVVVKAGLRSAFGSRQARLLAVFVLWTAASVAWAYVQIYAFSSIRPLLEYLMFAAVTAHVIDRRSRLDRFAFVAGLAVVLLVVRNHAKLGAAQRTGGFTAPYFLGDGNDFAWGMNTLAPIVLWLLLAGRGWLARGWGLVAVTACAFGTIGTQSRGGFLGLAVAVAYGYLFVLRRKVLGAVAIVVALAGLAVVSPAGYVNRMETITTYQEDNSAQARLQAWGAAVRMAADYPLGVGAGNFNSAYGRWYNPSSYGEGEARVDWGRYRWISAHSIYFKTLGEYGFGGCMLLIMVILSSIADNVRSRRALRTMPEGAPFEERWPALLNMSLIGFAVSGIFLGGLSYPHLFLLSGLTVGLKRVIALEGPLVPAQAGRT